MRTICILYLLSTLFAVASASNTRGGVHRLQDDVNEDEKVNTASNPGRKLPSTAQCSYIGSTVFFNVQTSVIPGTGATVCSDATLEAIGTMINAALIDAGVSTFSGSIFLAGMCDTPLMETYSTTGYGMNNLNRRKLQTGFIWTGGGVSMQST